MELTYQQNTKLNKIINEDSLFLQALGLMDYSLLLVIEETSSKLTTYDSSSIANSMLSPSQKRSMNIDSDINFQELSTSQQFKSKFRSEIKFNKNSPDETTNDQSFLGE